MSAKQYALGLAAARAFCQDQALLDSLVGRERAVLERRVAGQTLRSIAEEFNDTVGRVAVIERRGLKNILEAGTRRNSLDAAWAEAEAAAKAKGRVVYGIHRKATGWWAGATPGSSVQKLSVLVTDGAFADTPAAALRALTAKLREAPP